MEFVGEREEQRDAVEFSYVSCEFGPVTRGSGSTFCMSSYFLTGREAPLVGTKAQLSSLAQNKY